MTTDPERLAFYQSMLHSLSERLATSTEILLAPNKEGFNLLGQSVENYRL